MSVRQLTEEEHAALPWLHIYAQSQWHMPAEIAGTRQALLNLRAAIDRALAGTDAEAEAIAADGEGYGVHVCIRNLAWLEKKRLPYADPIAHGRAADDY